MPTAEQAPFRLEGDDDDPSEVTIEMDPGLFDLAYLVSMKQMGFNQISLVVQSLDDDLLTTIGRIHCAINVYCSVNLIRQVFREEDANYSIDLVSGVPGLTVAR